MTHCKAPVEPCGEWNTQPCEYLADRPDWRYRAYRDASRSTSRQALSQIRGSLAFPIGRWLYGAVY